MASARERLTPLLDALTALDLPLTALQAFDPDHSTFDATRPLLVLPGQFEVAAARLAVRYPAQHPARTVIDGASRPATVAVLPREAAAWLIEALPAERDVRALAGLRAVMERLYGPDGCPWDRDQTHESLRKYLLEEAYELVAAIDDGDAGHLREELGDLLAHIFMHTSIAQEQGEFTVEDVVEGITSKMVRRHPHVFGDEAAGSHERLLERWDEIKAAERLAAGADVEAAPEGALDSVPLAAPALQRAQLLQQRAGRAGALEPALPPLQALARAVGALGPAPTEANVGRLLWAAVRVARDLDVDAEEALRATARSFTAAFAGLEARARASSLELPAMPAEERVLPWTVR